MPRYCCIFSCEYFAGCPDSTKICFFRTPKNPQVRDAWLQEIRKHQAVDIRFVICQLHFEKHCLQNDSSGRARLKPNAIPTIFAEKEADTRIKEEEKTLTNQKEPIILYTLPQKPGAILQNSSVRSTSPVPKVLKLEPCYRCIQLDVKMQHKDAKISLLEEKSKEQQKTIKNLKSRLIHYKSKLRAQNPKLINVMSTQENCIVCRKTFLSPGEDHICDEGDLIYCEYCEQSFKSIIDLVHHLNSYHNEKKFYKCGKCPRIFAMELLLKFHSKIHENAKPRHICDICDERCYTVYQIRYHMKEVHSNNIQNQSDRSFFHCGMCGKRFENEKHLNRHIINIHEKTTIGLFECYLCKLKFTSLLGTQNHLEICHKRDEKCVICNKEFTAAELEEHLCTGFDNEIVCIYCQYLATSTKNVLEHLGKDCEREKLLYKCEICSTFFAMEILRDIHAKHHQEVLKPFMCDACPSQFATKILLQTHRKRMHKAVKELLCEQCGKAFNTASKLKLHKLYHGDKQFKCPDCDSRYYRKSQLKEHRLIHQKFRFVCNICGKTMRSLKSLSGHTRKHRLTDSDRKHACIICPKRFFCSRQLRIHLLQTHSSEKPFSCSLCGKMYKYKGDLDKHKRQLHIEEKDNI